MVLLTINLGNLELKIQAYIIESYFIKNQTQFLS